jgi:hypothetical protein
MRLIYYICFFLIILFFICTGCFKKKKILLFKEPPVSYQPTTFGMRSKYNVNYAKDLLNVFSMPKITADTSKKLDFMCSIVEIYDKNDSLLHRSIATETYTHQVGQKCLIHSFSADTFKVRSWGFGYVLADDKESQYDRKKLYFGTTSYKEQMFPVKLSEGAQAYKDSVKKAQAIDQ